MANLYAQRVQELLAQASLQEAEPAAPRRRESRIQAPRAGPRVQREQQRWREAAAQLAAEPAAGPSRAAPAHQTKAQKLRNVAIKKMIEEKNREKAEEQAALMYGMASAPALDEVKTRLERDDLSELRRPTAKAICRDYDIITMMRALQDEELEEEKLIEQGLAPAKTLDEVKTRLERDDLRELRQPTAKAICRDYDIITMIRALQDEELAEEKLIEQGLAPAKTLQQVKSRLAKRFPQPTGRESTQKSIFRDHEIFLKTLKANKLEEAFEIKVLESKGRLNRFEQTRLKLLQNHSQVLDDQIASLECNRDEYSDMVAKHREYVRRN